MLILAYTAMLEKLSAEAQLARASGLLGTKVTGSDRLLGNFLSSTLDSHSKNTG